MGTFDLINFEQGIVYTNEQGFFFYIESKKQIPWFGQIRFETVYEHYH